MPVELSTVPFVLMYHSIAGRDHDPYHITVTPDRFARQMHWLARHRLRGVSMGELLDAADRGSTRGLVGLTFDDGYADFPVHVVPLLARLGFTATVFVVAGKLGGSNDWELHGPVKPLMTADQVREVAARGAEIGSHGFGHRSLADGGADLAVEVERSRDILASLVGAPVRGFCYPYGDLCDGAAIAARTAGYDYAVATWPSARRDRHALPRTHVAQRDQAARLRAKLLRHRLTWGGSR